MVASPIDDCTTSSTNGNGDTVIAQYLATKVTWWATYPRILIFTSSTLSTYNPETFQCTNQWEIADIEDVEVLSTPNQFVLKLEKSRFRSAKLRFVCTARGHLLSLVARLRRQVTVSSIIFLDEDGRRVQTLPFLYLSKVAFSSEHSEGMVLSTAYHDRFFLCGERHECLNEIVAAANEAGVQIYKTASPITALQLRLMNTQVLDRPTIMCFDVKKTLAGNGDAVSGSDSSEGGGKKAYKMIQLILQGDALVEMHSSMQTVIARPYTRYGIKYL
ncbi:hypothetical protein BBJ29_001131 [Phytophthora kernoviae]|uniref:DnaJ homologue subfamily C GRV2/DNAJC13 N-terminal domain-containing protein n=1 Tax=Phytophthora kernoviae TaxID=325452 RepID=A0A3F2S145_9STRA|nr:hypothetical protein BBJ29_001131 [Phytophthora kernoviae]RLN68175.1 hypothetical protein BBP00_00001146 [Phytophthora kernoviae]